MTSATSSAAAASTGAAAGALAVAFVQTANLSASSAPTTWAGSRSATRSASARNWPARSDGDAAGRLTRLGQARIDVEPLPQDDQELLVRPFAVRDVAEQRMLEDRGDVERVLADQAADGP